MDGTGNPKDTLPGTGQTSEGEKGTSGGEPETYTKEQAEKLISDALAKAGRTAKQLEKREAEIKTRDDARQAELDARQKRLDDAEFEAIKGDPDLETAYKNKKRIGDAQKTLDEDRRKLEAEKLEHADRLKTADDMAREISIWKIAIKHNADPAVVKEKADYLGATSEEQVEAIAEMIGSKEVKPSLKPDSGMTRGGGQDLSSLSGRKLIEKGLEKKK